MEQKLQAIRERGIKNPARESGVNNLVEPRVVGREGAIELPYLHPGRFLFGAEQSIGRNIETMLNRLLDLVIIGTAASISVDYLEAALVVAVIKLKQIQVHFSFQGAPAHPISFPHRIGVRASPFKYSIAYYF